MNPAGYLLEIFRHTPQAGNDVRDLLPRRVQFWRQRRLGRAHLEPQRHEALLRTVVQVAFESATSAIRGRDNPGP
jgi:hypothetical protein